MHCVIGPYYILTAKYCVTSLINDEYTRVNEYSARINIDLCCDLIGGELYDLAEPSPNPTTYLTLGDVLVLFDEVKQRQGILTAGQTDEQPVSVPDHVVLNHRL